MGLHYKSHNQRWLAALALSLIMLALVHWGPGVIVTHIVIPKTDNQQSGWRVRFSEPRRSGLKDHYRDVIPAIATNPLPQDYGALSAFAVWDVPKTGHYQLLLKLAGEGRLAVDGQTVVVLPPADRLEQKGEGWVHLAAGRHVLRVTLKQEGAGGSFSLGFQEPPLMRVSIISGTQVSLIDMGSLETWWLLMAAGHRLRPVALGGVVICLLALMLPLTLANRRRSVAVWAGIVLVPALVLAPVKTEEPYIAPMVHRQLAAKSPEFVFIGNSMLWSRIDDKHLSTLLGGRPVHSIVNFGGLSGIHYLALKYLLIGSGVKPERTFIFFRSTTLVNPQARTRGPYFDKLIRRISPGPDEVFLKIAYGRHTDLKVRLADWLECRFPVMRSQDFVREQLSRGAARLAVAGSADVDDGFLKTLRRQVNRRLGFGNLNKAGKNGLDIEARGLDDNTNFLDFDALVADSFLPAILDLAAEQGLPLAFIRVQERPQAAGMPPDSPEMVEFIRALQDYLARHDAAFYDFTGDPAITLDMYALGDHIREPKDYTDIFFQRLGHLLK